MFHCNVERERNGEPLKIVTLQSKTKFASSCGLDNYKENFVMVVIDISVKFMVDQQCQKWTARHIKDDWPKTLIRRQIDQEYLEGSTLPTSPT